MPPKTPLGLVVGWIQCPEYSFEVGVIHKLRSAISKLHILLKCAEHIYMKPDSIVNTALIIDTVVETLETTKSTLR